MKTRPVSDAKAVAFFDFDGTLTTGDSLMPFLKFVVGKPRYYATLALVSPVLIGYFTKLIPNDIAKGIILKRYLAGYRAEELFTFGKQFSDQIISTMLRKEGMELLKWHQELGHICVLVSASLDIYLASWANANGFNHLISSKLRCDDAGRVSGELLGNNCFGLEKTDQVNKWLAQNPSATTYAYGDSKGDLPMLRLVKHGKMLKGRTFVRVSSDKTRTSTLTTLP